MGIYKKLSVIQKELKSPKNQFNSFGKYNYRSCEDILEAAKPLSIKHGAVLTTSDKIINVGDRYYVEATATLTDIEDDSQIMNTASARESLDKKGMDSSQITGTASSYARKYALNGLFCIDDTKDADTDEHKVQSNQSTERVVKTDNVTKVTVAQLTAAMKKKGVTEEQIFATYKKDANKTCSDLKFLPQEYKVKYLSMCK